MATTTTCFTGVDLHKLSIYHVLVTLFKRPYDIEVARNRSALGNVLALGASDRDITAVFMKIIGHIGHFRWLGQNVWWKISQIWMKYIKPIGQMSDESWKFFRSTALQ